MESKRFNNLSFPKIKPQLRYTFKILDVRVVSIWTEVRSMPEKKPASVNAIEVKKDLGKNWSKLYWTPRGKPNGISKKNPSDVIVQLKDGSFEN